MIFDVDNHPMAYVLLMQPWLERSAHLFVLRKNDCEPEAGYQRGVIHAGILRF
jgi:hypothetical protein